MGEIGTPKSKLRIEWPGCTDEEIETFEFLRFPYAGVPVGQQVLVDFELCNDTWALEIYPGGEKHEDVENISIFVRYRGNKEVVNAVFSMNVIDANEEKNVPVFDCVSVTYDSEHKRWGRKKAISRKDVQIRSFSGNFTLRLSLRIVFSGTHPPEPEIKRVCLAHDNGTSQLDFLLGAAGSVPSLQSDMARLLDNEVVVPIRSQPNFEIPQELSTCGDRLIRT
jgi:hypothetical protein